MSIPGSVHPLFLGAAGQATGEGGYLIERSLRFNSPDSAYLSRTPSVSGNRKTWTWAGWVKRSSLTSGQQCLIGNYDGSSGAYARLAFNSDDTFWFQVGGAGVYRQITSAVFRDAGAWYHVVANLDTTQATDTNRCKLWINGVLQTFGTTNYPPLDYAGGHINQNIAHAIGAEVSGASAGGYLNGYLADIHFIDGQALDPTSFGEFDANGIWQPKAYSGTYGTNGFQLKFADNSAATATTLGKDTSGNGNNWTPNNLSVTAGAGNDSLVDSPTNGTASSGGDAGGVVVGNYCTWNPVARLEEINFNLTNGNLDFSQSASNNAISYATFALDSGKWYWEVVHTALANANYDTATYIATDARLSQTASPRVKGVAYLSNGNKKVNDANTSYGSSYTTGDVIGIALDADSNSVAYYKNGVSQGAISLTYISGYCPAVLQVNGSSILTGSANFGQRPFAYPVSGFKALCTANLPAPLITKPNTVMDVALWTGTGATNAITGLGFSPDLVWIKKRSAAADHNLVDSVRVGTRPYLLYPNLTHAENTSYTLGVQSLDSAGFTLGTDGDINGSGATYAGWCWDAGSSTVTNTQGSITSSVRANASAGFSIVTYTGNATNSTIGHGLGVAPELLILKNRDGASNWAVWHKAFGTAGATDYLYLNSTIAKGGDGSGSFWNSTVPTSTVFSIGNGSTTNTNANKYVAYCFAPVAGYSSFGSYTGNGSADGPFVYTSHLPKLILIKRTDTTSNWTILDTSREGYNVDNDPLYPNLADAEGTADLLDITSNGFKLRSTDASVNASGGTYIYASWASSPFNYSRAR